MPSLTLISPYGTQHTAQKLWGLDVDEWQNRAYEKIGVAGDNEDPASNHLVLARNWILSSPLMLALRDAPGTALLVEGKIVAAHTQAQTPMADVRSALRRNDHKALEKLGLTLLSARQLAGVYNEALRKCETPFALNIETTPPKLIERKLYDSSYKGVTDFVTKYFWPLPAFHFTRACAALKITPNMVTTLSLIMVVAAFYFFINGQWLAGFASGWFMTFLDTVDGKLARTTMRYSKWGHIYDHGIDLIHPPFWYFAWYGGLTIASPAPDWLWLCLVAILAGYLVDRIIEGLFIARFGFHIHVWKPIDAFVRTITARRNPNMFIFMLGIFALSLWPEAGFNGFAAVAIWTWVCIGFHLIRLLQAYVSRRRVITWMGAELG